VLGMQPPEMWLRQSCGLPSDVYRSAHLHPSYEKRRSNFVMIMAHLEISVLEHQAMVAGKCV